MIASVDTGTAMIAAAVIAAIPALITLWVRRSISQINRAVNHVKAGEPTLIERVRRIEEDQHHFREWVFHALKAVAVQVGTTVSDPPTKEKA